MLHARVRGASVGVQMRHKQAAAISAAAAAENATLLPTAAKGEITCITLLCMKAKVKVAGGRRE